MKLKLFLALSILVSCLCIASVASAQAMTDAQKQALIAQIKQQLAQLEAQLQQMLAQQQGTASWCYTFNTNLGYAQSGTNDVDELHLALQQQGISYAPDDINTYYTGTSQGVIAFQAKYGISPQSGYVGLLTRTQLNQLYGCSAANTTTTTNTATTSCTPNWVCNGWTSCLNNQLTRTCADYNNCGTSAGMPTTTESCTATNTNTTTNTSTNCTQNYQIKCSGNSIFEYDSCGNQGSFLQTCLSTQTCSNGSCNGSSTNTTTSNSCEAACPAPIGGITYAVDCYGGVTTCSSGQFCKLIYDTTPTYNSTTGAVIPNSTLTGAQCTTPTPVLATIQVTPSSTNLTVGGTQSLTANTLDQNGNSIYASVNWTSSNTAVATVNSYGSVTAVAQGSAYITASSGSITSIAATITVTTVPVNTCKAACVTYSGVAYPVACDGTTVGSACGSSQVCNLNYNTTNTYVNGQFQQTQTLTGAQCNTICNPSWQTGSWTTCSGGQQTRTVTDSNNCGVTAGEPASTQSCTVCNPNWQTGAWGTCTNSQQTRTVTDSNNCGVTTNEPVTSQSCCSPQWSCTGFGACSAGKQSQSCTDVNNCGVATGEPALTQSCIICKTNLDCGQSAYSGLSRCSSGNVYQTYTAYTCNNPGTTSSSCSVSTGNQQIDTCAPQCPCTNSANGGYCKCG